MLPVRPLVLLGLSALAVAALLVACGGSDPPPPKPEDGAYENRRLRYAFEYPSEWADHSAAITLKVSEGTPDLLDNVAVGRYDATIGLLSGVHVFVVKVKEQVTEKNREAFFADLDDAFRRHAQLIGGRLAEPRAVELGGLPARQYIIEFVYGTVQAASAQTITFWGDRQYAVNCQDRVSTFDDQCWRGASGCCRPSAFVSASSRTADTFVAWGSGD